MKARQSNTAAVMTELGRIVLEERPVPEPKPGEVLVEIHTVTICGSDVHYFRHGRIADFVVDGPIVLGHEASGTVVGTGRGVDASRVGERVALEPGVSCRTCRHCMTGRYNLCPDMAFYATPPYDGALQRYVALPAELVHRVPDDMPFERAALVEPLAVAVQAVRRAGLAGGERVLVAGAGAIGLLCAQVAAAMGAGEVVVVDTDAGRVSLARDVFGVTAVMPEELDGTFDRFLECSGAHAALVSGVRRLYPGGTAVLIGMGVDEGVLPLGWMLVNEITLVGTFRYANAYQAAIQLAAAGAVRIEELIGRRVDLADAAGAFPTDGTVLRAAVRVHDSAGAERQETEKRYDVA
jgi:L-iditol 2-dehydrogenase